MSGLFALWCIFDGNNGMEELDFLPNLIEIYEKGPTGIISLFSNGNFLKVHSKKPFKVPEVKGGSFENHVCSGSCMSGMDYF